MAQPSACSGCSCLKARIHKGFLSISDVTLGADLTAAGTGDNGVGTLTIAAGANVSGANITLRGADVDISSTSNVGVAGVAPVITTFATTVANSAPDGLAFDASGNLYVANYSGTSISKVMPAGVVTTFICALV